MTGPGMFENRGAVSRFFREAFGDEVDSAVAAVMEPAFEKAGVTWTEKMRRRVGSGGSDFAFGPFGAVSGLAGSAAPRSRSGGLRRSFRSQTVGKGSVDTLRGEMFSVGGIVAWAQEYGTKGRNPRSPIATIRPKKANGWLTIPLRGALTKSGRASQGRASARNFKDTFFLKSKKGNLLIVQRKGKGKAAKIIPLFVLKKSVDLYPRLGMRDTFDEVVGARFQRDLSKAVADSVALLVRRAEPTGGAG